MPGDVSLFGVDELTRKLSSTKANSKTDRSAYGGYLVSILRTGNLLTFYRT